MLACLSATECVDIIQCKYTGTISLKWKEYCKHNVVITGDLLDRKRSNYEDADNGSEEEYMLFISHILSLQSRKQGGLFVRLLGNHEIMNALGVFTHVTNNAMQYYNTCCGGRRHHFKCGSEGALDLCHYGARVVLKLGNIVFMHAGVGCTNDHDIVVKYTHTNKISDQVNKIVHDMLSGDRRAKTLYEQIASVFLWDRTQGATHGV